MNHDPYAALRLPGYRLLLASSLTSAVGFGVTTVAVAVDIYRRTDSAFALGLTGLVQFVPILLLALPAGQVADRHDRKAVFRISLSVVAAGYLGLATLAWAGGPVWAVFVCLALIGVGRIFTLPARVALLRQVVPVETLANAVGWNSTGWQVASIAGPVLGGLMLWLAEPVGAYLLAAALALTGVLLLGPVRPAAQIVVAAADVTALLAGVRFVWDTKLMLAAITLDLFAVLLGGATALLPVFAREVLKIDEAGLAVGLLRAAPAAGAVVMALWLAYHPLRRPGRALLLSVAGFGLATVGFGLSTSFWLSFAMLAAAGALDNVSVVVRGTLMHVLTPDEMRGRVAAVNSVFVSSSNELGEFESGVTAGWFGPVAAVVGGGVGTLVVVAFAAWQWPMLWRLGPLTELMEKSGSPSAPRDSREGVRTDLPSTDVRSPSPSS
ncbi:MAG: MFS transporter [Gemmataceae bacterium]